jgi:hypothetical protein
MEKKSAKSRDPFFFQRKGLTSEKQKERFFNNKKYFSELSSPQPIT